MTSSEPPVPSDQEPVGERPVLPTGIEAGIVGGLGVGAVILARDVLAGAPLETPSVLGLLLFQGPDSARGAVSAPGAAIAYNVVHFGLWVLAGSIATALMRQVDRSAANWYRPWVAAGLLFAGVLFASQRAAATGLPQLHLWLGTISGVGAMAVFLGWRYPTAMRRVRRMGGS